MYECAPLAVLEPAPPLLLVSCSPVAQLTPVTPVDPMEALWHAQFDSLFCTFWPSDWRLLPKPLVRQSVTDWNAHTDAAKVRFLCELRKNWLGSDTERRWRTCGRLGAEASTQLRSLTQTARDKTCGHGWTSMKGRVVFWHTYDAVSLRGIVSFSLFGQKCQECSRRGADNFTSAMWYQEEVVKVLYNVYNSVGQTYYGFHRPPYVKVRRPGKPRSQHASDLCQACQMGLCKAAAEDHSPDVTNACQVIHRKQSAADDKTR